LTLPIVSAQWKFLGRAGECLQKDYTFARLSLTSILQMDLFIIYSVGTQFAGIAPRTLHKFAGAFCCKTDLFVRP